MQPYSRQDRQVARRVLVVVRVILNRSALRWAWPAAVDGERPRRRRVYVQGSRRRRCH